MVMFMSEEGGLRTGQRVPGRRTGAGAKCAPCSAEDQSKRRTVAADVRTDLEVRHHTAQGRNLWAPDELRGALDEMGPSTAPPPPPRALQPPPPFGVPCIPRLPPASIPLLLMQTATPVPLPPHCCCLLLPNNVDEDAEVAGRAPVNNSAPLGGGGWTPPPDSP